MNVRIVPCKGFSGELIAPPSKARTHRALVAGLLSKGTTTIENPLSCDDTKATLHAIVALGARVERTPTIWIVRGNDLPGRPDGEIFCGESAATLRFMAPVATLTGGTVVLTGKTRLMQRPLNPLIEALREIGATVELSENRLIVDGRPQGGVAHIRGDVSSQFISGLLFAGPLMPEGLRIELTSPLESRNYLSLTLEIMKQHGIEVTTRYDMSGFEIKPRQTYSPATHRVPGDYSSAAFALSAAAITHSKLLVRGLPRNDHEPDSVITGILSRMGAKTSAADEGVMVVGSELRGTRVDLRDNPDLGPIVAVLGCYAEGETRIEGAARLRHKESDRLSVITAELNSLSANVEVTENGLNIDGPCSLDGGTVDSHGDHRIAMALAVASLGAREEVEIRGAECVSKSYPGFFQDLRSLGVNVVE